MIYREYTTEYDDFTECVKHSINITTDNHHVFRTIKAYAEKVCEGEDNLFCEDASEERKEE